jgi:arylsulfatase A-like enzyme
LLIRQGPKDLRLFVSLFASNHFGRAVVPELYFLGGVPLTTKLGRRARFLINELATTTQPFFLNVFLSTTHPPFASEYPWYTKFADPAYTGESKFAMARLTDPLEIIRRQGEPRSEFDLDQIISLYNGCVAQFDHEVGSLLQHLERCGLADNTIVMLYSDHGMEFFEHGTWGQGNSVIGDVSPRVPLVIYDPRDKTSRKIDAVTRSIDIAPTILDLIGADRPAGIEGISLMPLMRGNVNALNLAAYNETGIWVTDMPGQHPQHLRYPHLLELLDVPNEDSGTLAIASRYHAIVLEAKDRMIREGNWKLTYQPLVDGYVLSLFDLAHDPDCTHDVFQQYPEHAAHLWNLLSAWIKNTSEIAPHT